MINFNDIGLDGKIIPQKEIKMHTYPPFQLKQRFRILWMGDGWYTINLVPADQRFNSYGILELWYICDQDGKRVKVS